MSTIQKTFKQLRDFDQMVGKLFEENPELKNTKFGYSVKRFNEKNYIPVLKKYRTAVEDIYIEHALVDEKTKAIILDKDSNRGFAYSKDGLRKVIEAEGKIIEEWDQKLFDIETYVCTDLPELTEEQLVLIDGILK